MADLYRMTLKASKGGRSSRDLHTIVLLVRSTGAFDRAKAKTFAQDVAKSFAAVQFDDIYYQTASFARLKADMTVDKGFSFREDLVIRGVNAMPDGATYASEKVVMDVDKQADYANGVTHLRHVLTGTEWAAWLAAETVPGRFTVSPVGSYNAGHDLPTNLKKAAADNSYQFELPPVVGGSNPGTRVVTSIVAAKFSEESVTKRRKTADKSITDGVQRKLDKYSADVAELLEPYGAGVKPLAVINAVNAIVEVATNLFEGLAPAEMIKVKFPSNLVTIIVPVGP